MKKIDQINFIFMISKNDNDILIIQKSNKERFRS